MIVATVFGKIVSIFIIMLVGVICYKVGIIDNSIKEKLSRLVTQIVNPVLIFMSFQMEYDAALLKNLGILFVLAVSSFLISIAAGHFCLRQKDGYDVIIEKFSVTYTNCGFIGVPLGYALFGSVGVVYVTVFIAVFHIFVWSHGILLLENKGFRPQKLINPCLIAVAIGLIFFIFQIKVPEQIGFALEAIGDMNTPLAMMLSGAIMAQINFRETFKKKRIYYVVFLRLILSSAVFALLVRWMPLEEQLRTIAAMTAACPAGVMTITMAVLYQRDDQYATEIFALETIFSIITIPLCLYIAG